MDSTFSGIEIGKRSLFAHTRGLTTIGHNMSNASREGYSRQRVEMGAMSPLYAPELNRAETPGQLGQGVEVSRIERIRDGLLERRIVANASGEGYWDSRDRYITMLEQVYQEPGETSVRGLMDRFWESWQELSLYPEQMSARQTVLERGESLVDAIQLRYNGFEQIRSMLEDDIQVTVARVNELSGEIASLNERIVNVQAAGDNPNDLLDRRDLLVEELGTLVDIRIDERDPDEFSVHTAGFHIVQGRISREFALEANRENEGFSMVTWEHSGEEVEFRSGKLAAIVELRDVDLREEIQALDNMTINVADLVNEIHRDGYGLNERTGLDFFVERPFVLNALGNYDANGDGTFEESRIFRFTGSNNLEANAQVGLEGTMTLPGPEGTIDVSYRGTDTVSDIITRINQSGAEVVARLNREGALTIKATPAEGMENPDFVIRSLEDSGQFLAGYAGILSETGPEGAYNWQQADAVLALEGADSDTGATWQVAPMRHPSGYLSINENLRSEPASIASSFSQGARPGESGDGSAALEIASLRNSSIMLGSTATLDDFFAQQVATVALKGEEAETSLDSQELLMKDLRDTRASISGVNIDEELAQMIKYQHGYQAAARFISNIDQMLDTIINRMGA